MSLPPKGGFEPDASLGPVTEGGLLGGKLRYRQLSSGHRSGFEPVLLAASISAKRGEHILEAGCGAGAALLCLSQRVDLAEGIGLEIDEFLPRLANENFKTNGLNNLFCVRADATRPPFGRVFDQVMANPPWYDEAGTHSADKARALAHHAKAGLLAGWIDGLTSCLKPGGRISLIIQPAAFAQAATCLRGAGYGGLALFGFWPRAGLPAKMAILTAKRGSRSPDRLLAGLVLHDEAGITPEAQAILRDGAALQLAPG